MIYFILAILMLFLLICIITISRYNRQIKKLNQYIKLIIYDFSKTKLKTETNNSAINEFITTINEFIKKHNTMVSQNEINKKQYQKLISSIAHDFKTPATSILGYIELVENEKDEEKKIKYLKIIKQRIENLNILIDNFFILSVLETNDYPYYLEEINPKSILQEQLAIYYDGLDSKFSNIQIHLGNNLIYIKSDQNALTRIFNNLIKNALTYGKQCLRVEEKISKEYYYIKIINIIDYDLISKNKFSTKFGLNIINKFAEDLKINFTTKEINDEFIVELGFELK